MKTEFKPIQTLNQRTFKKNRGRNLVAIIAILMTTIPVYSGTEYEQKHGGNDFQADWL